jgi:hypothetical protein
MTDTDDTVGPDGPRDDGDDATATGSDSQMTSGDEWETDEETETTRRGWIKWVALVAFVIPVLIEVVTFGGLAVESLFGGDEETATATRTATASAGTDAVTVGDDLLPETPVTETVARSVVRGATDRTYVLRVTVENPTDVPVELRLGTLTVYDGQTVESQSSTGTVPAGGEGEVTGAWELPSGEMPRRVVATELRNGEVAVEREVALARPPIDG